MHRDLDIIRVAYGQNDGYETDRMIALERVFDEARMARDATPWVRRLEWERADGQLMIRLVDTRQPPARWVTANSGPDYRIPDSVIDAQVA
jgi:hypothetical protein